MKLFKARSSAVGKIMAEAQGKSPLEKHDDLKEKIAKKKAQLEKLNPETKTAQKLPGEIKIYKAELIELAKVKDDMHLGGTCTTYCQDWLKEQIYQRRVEFTSKYTSKGNIMEDDSLDFIADSLGLGMLIKNEEYFENDFITGTPDTLPREYVIDAKNSWSFATFPLLDTELTNKDYWWQMQSYMWLADKKKAKVLYTLMDTPLHLIESEAKRHCWSGGYDYTDEILEEFKKRMTYPDIPKEMRIKSFDVECHEGAIESIKARVIECRTYIKTLIELLPSQQVTPELETADNTDGKGGIVNPFK